MRSTDAQARDLHSPGIFTLAIIFRFEKNGFCYTMHAQITIYVVFVAASRLNLSALKSKRWIVLYIEEIR